MGENPYNIPPYYIGYITRVRTTLIVRILRFHWSRGRQDEWQRKKTYVERRASHFTWPWMITVDSIKFSLVIMLKMPLYILIIHQMKAFFTRITIMMIRQSCKTNRKCYRTFKTFVIG